ncbi:MAG TPA: helix-turn-helix transcriptional regulator [Thermoanaerobaculia bacterium]|nr:helix-turn-helix transcriptional regulator [Thermoanaerobaculia bacterium]
MNASLLVREVERIARERGWSRRRLARELGIDATTLSHVRSGRDPISQPLLVQIGMAFGGSPVVQSLILHYLLIEAPPRLAKRRKGATTSAFAAIPYKVRWRIRRWLAHLDGTGKPQRGLFLTGTDAALLSAAARFTVHEAEQQGRTHILIAASDRLTTTHAKAALDTGLLVLERVEFAAESVTRLIHARTDALRPLVATSCGDREQLPDPHLVRVFRAWTETITVSAPRTPTTRRHAQRS